MIKLTPEQAAPKAYNSTATVRGTNGVSYLISCWHTDAAGTILARAARFYEQEMSEVVNVSQLWTV